MPGVRAFTDSRKTGARGKRGRIVAIAVVGGLAAAVWPGAAMAQGITSNPLPPASVGSGGGQEAQRFAPAAGSGPGEAQLMVRVDQLEAQVRGLTGQVEQYEHRIRQLEDQLRRFQEDVEFRFRESGAPLSSGGRADTGRDAPSGGATGAVRDTPRFEPPTARAGPGQPPTYGGIRPLRAPGQEGYNPPAAEPLNINPAARGGPPPGTEDRFAPPAPREPVGPGNNSGEVALAVPQDAQTSYDVAYAFILQRDYEAAQSAFGDFLARYPDDKLAGNAQYWLGESHYARGDYRQAADAFLSGYRNYPGGGKGPDSLLKLGMSLAALGEKKAACATYAEFSSKFPGASPAMKNRVQAESKGAGC